MGDTMVDDSTIMTTCMSLFSNPLLDFDLMPNFFDLHKHVFFANTTHAYLYEMICLLE